MGRLLFNVVKIVYSFRVWENGEEKVVSIEAESETVARIMIEQIYGGDAELIHAMVDALDTPHG